MKEKIRKIFAFLGLQIIFSINFPFIDFKGQQEEKVNITKNQLLVRDQLVTKESNPEISHTEYQIGGDRNWFISGISSTASAVSGFIEDIFHMRH